MGYSCRVLADSVSEAGVRLTTLEVTFPRLILAEINTHRMLSRSSASSRAIPISTLIKRVEEDPFIPKEWGSNQKGMQAGEALSAEDAGRAEWAWRQSRMLAVPHAKYLADIGVHKQLANRLLEPFMWHTAIISATEWRNFFALRCHAAAQPEMQKTARLMRETMAASTPTELETYDWHLPLVPDYEELAGDYCSSSIAMISSARCARVSYLTHDGKRDPQADLGLARKLLASGHMSPFEHAAYVPGPWGSHEAPGGFFGNFRGWRQFRKTIANEDNYALVKP